jgi:hypothetical protein
MNWRPALIAVLLTGCVAERYSPGSSSALPAPERPLAAVVQVTAVPSGEPEMDRQLCEEALSDLRGSGIFQQVVGCGAYREGPLLDAVVWKPRTWDMSKKQHDATSIRFALYWMTAGLLPFSLCSPGGYDLTFSAGQHRAVALHFVNDECILAGWIAPFMNLRTDYFWPVRGRQDWPARARNLRAQLSPLQGPLLDLAGNHAAPE